MRKTASYIKKGLQVESKIKETEEGGGSTKNTIKTKVPTVMTLLPHVFPGNSALRK
jgi:hypothetical protein